MIKLLLCLMCLGIATSCGFQNQQDPILPHGVKPVIFYKEKLYWMTPEKPVKELPSGYVDTGDTITGSETDADIVPSKECVTSAYNSNHVGSKIYYDPSDDHMIFINDEYDDLYRSFINE